MKKLALVLFVAVRLMTCTEIGSEAWCNDIKKQKAIGLPTKLLNLLRTTFSNSEISDYRSY